VERFVSRRAIILVPGFGRKEQNQERDKLALAIQSYADGWKVDPADAAPADAVQLGAVSRQDGTRRTIDIYEAYWGDLIPDWSEESPVTRVKRGALLIRYWLTGGLRGWWARGQVPPRTSVAMILAALLLLVWYLVVILLLVQLFGTGGLSLPAPLAEIETLQSLWARAAAWAGTVAGSVVVALAVWLWGLGFLEQFANISAYTKAYLRDECFGGSEIGLRAKARQRVLAALDLVAAAEGAGEEAVYDEILVVAHSLGGAIALDALAEYGKRLDKTVLMTWGSALGSLAQQEPLIERQIAKLHEAETPIRGWVDIVFRKDFMGSRAPVPRKFVDGQPTREMHDDGRVTRVTPVLPEGMGLFEMLRIHDAYYRCEEAILRLVEPLDGPGAQPQLRPDPVKLAASSG
jgi:pimeloyl-ACP methyl ester carboxylesterase